MAKNLSYAQISAIIGSVVILVEGIRGVFSLNAPVIVGGIIGIILSILLFASIGLFNIHLKYSIPFEWKYLLILGIIAIWPSVIGAVLIIISAVLQFLEK